MAEKPTFFRTFLLLVAATLLSGTASSEEITLETLLGEMTDRASLARFPDPPYTCRQFSSYDRRSKEPGNPDWFANLDNRQYLRTEERGGRTEKVCMDADGPGAIVRFWVTAEGPGHGNGTLRIYLDGAAEPAIEGEVFEVISGGLLAGEPLSKSVPPSSKPGVRGHNLYLPIPYAKACKVTFEPAEDRPFFYQINYRTYGEGVAVRTFTRDDLERLDPFVRRTESVLSRAEEPLDTTLARVAVRCLEPGSRFTDSIPGPAAIRELRLLCEGEDREQALRSTVLRIAFDGESTVWCPVGDFFGTGHRICPYRSFYTSVTVDGLMTSRWVMPFAEEATISLLNLGDQDVSFRLSHVCEDGWAWNDRSLHFHATWHELYRKRTVAGRGEDVNFVTVEGRGVFAGDTLTVFNGSDGWGWWGEGDEKIYFDGQTFPSHFGTGTEDYYGYAWAREQMFESAFHAQPCGKGNQYGGYCVNSRYRGLDAIPFERSFRFDMELWHHRRTGIDYAPTTFWYARPGAVSSIAPDPVAAARPVAKCRDDVWRVYRVAGALEGEKLPIAEITGGKAELQRGFPPKWSGESQVWWRDGAVGDRIVFAFPVTTASRCLVFAGLTCARDYGIVKISINGTPVSEEIDRYSPELGCAELCLGPFDLNDGRNHFEIEIAGSHPDAIRRHMFGLDYLKLEPLK